MKSKGGWKLKVRYERITDIEMRSESALYIPETETFDRIQDALQ